MNLDIKVPHNKKRNVGLVYDFLVQKLTKATLDSNKSEISLITNIIKENFGKQSELKKELIFFKKIFNSSFSSKEIALRFIDEIKKEVKTINSTKLELEKTNLIHEINKQLNKDGMFFNQYSENYKDIATIQTLLNSWSGLLNESKFNTLFLEDNLILFLTTPKKQNSNLKPIDLQENIKKDSKLISKIMHQKFEEKYSKFLNEDQRNILNAYILDDKENLFELLVKTKQKVIAEIKDKKNYKELLEELNSLDPVPCDEHCTFFIGVLDILRADRGEVKE
jgi:hypothetical protein